MTLLLTTPRAYAIALVLGFIALAAIYADYRKRGGAFGPAAFAAFAVQWAGILISLWSQSLNRNGASGFDRVMRASYVICALSMFALAGYAVWVRARARQGGRRGLVMLIAVCSALGTIMVIEGMGGAVLGVAYSVSSVAAIVAVAGKKRQNPDTAKGVPIAASPARPAMMPATADSGDQGGLSAREREVAFLLANGLSYREIGERLFIAPSTVKTHALRVYEKMGVGNKAQLAVALLDSANAIEAPQD